MNWQEVTLSMGLAVLFTTMPVKTGNGQDTSNVVTPPSIPLATLKKEAQLKVKDQKIDSLFDKLDRPPVIIEKAVEQQVITGTIMDSTSRILVRAIMALPSKQSIYPKVEMIRSVSYSGDPKLIENVRPVEPAQISKPGIFERMFKNKR